MQEQKLIPELRFPEFEGVWVEKRLEKLFSEFKSGNGITSSEISQAGEYPVFGGNGLRGFTNQYTHDGYYFLIGRQGALCGNINRTYGKAFISEHAIACQGNNISDTEWLSQRLEYFNLNKLSESSAQPGLSVNKLLRFKLIVPSLPEQQKIASFLKAVDKRIQLLKQKKAQLEEYKKGVMQKLFSQELRFKDENGNHFPDWKEKKLGNVYSFKTTNSLSREKLNYESGTVKNIHYGDIHTKFKSHFDITNELVPYIKSGVDLSRIPDDNFLQEGDLVIADASEDYADIGKTIEIVNLNQEKVLAGLHTLLARRRSTEPVIGFSGHLMKSSALRLEIMKIAQGTKVLSISTTRLGDLIIQFPTKAEQQKIALFLSSLDEAIENIRQQVEHLRQFKQGLLQRMFV